ncbi:MAG: hypothetical protein LBS30_00415 [Planctomycetota bacterium]|jgi:hypothetical protein|nr:hypothetical protein [Planctomycetota bacterium]
MSLAAIQDSLVKTSLVQHTQTHNDNVGRSQEIGMAAQLREQERQEDQVVIRGREAEQHGVRDEEKKRDGKKRQREEAGERIQREDDGEDVDDGPRARMRCINIVV